MKIKRQKTHNLLRRLGALTLIFTFVVTNMVFADSQGLVKDDQGVLLMADGQEVSATAEIAPEQGLVAEYRVTMAADSTEQTISLPAELIAIETPQLVAASSQTHNAQVSADQFTVTRVDNQLTITRQAPPASEQPAVTPAAATDTSQMVPPAEIVPAVAGDILTKHLATDAPSIITQPAASQPQEAPATSSEAPKPGAPVSPGADGGQHSGVGLPPTAPADQPTAPPTGQPTVPPTGQPTVPPATPSEVPSGDSTGSAGLPIPAQPVGPGAGGGPQVGQPQPAPEGQPPVATMAEVGLVLRQPCTVNWNADQSPVTVKLGSRSYQLTPTPRAGGLSMAPFITSTKVTYATGANPSASDFKEIPIGINIPADATLQVESQIALNNAQLQALQTGENNHYLVATMDQYVKLQPLSVDIKRNAKESTTGVKFATLHIINQEIYVTFESDILTRLTNEGYTEPSIAGEMGFTCQLDQDAIRQAQTASVTIKLLGQEVTIPVATPPKVILAMEKAGVYRPSAGMIDWTVTTKPGDNSDWIGAVFEDTLQDGQTLVPDSFKINGTAETAQVSTTSSTITSRELVSGDKTSKGDMIITYSTYPPDSAFVDATNSGDIAKETTLKNTAKLMTITAPTATEVGRSNEASVTIKAADKAWVTKTGWHDAAHNKIHWIVTIKNNGYNLTNVVLHDEFSDTLTLDTSSVKHDQAVVATTAATSPPTGKQGFTVDIGSLSQDYVLTYDTTVDASFYEKPDDSSKGSIENEVWLTFNWKGHEGTDYTSTFKPPTVTQVDIPPAPIVKWAKGYDAANQEITWEIIVNQHHVNLSEVVVTDTLGENQAIIPQSAQTITYRYWDATGKEVPLNAPSVTEVQQGGINGTGEVTFDFKGIATGTNKITFQYKTKVTKLEDFGINTPDDKIPKYKNTASLAGMVTPSTGGTAIAIAGTATATQEVKSLVLTKAATGYDYATKRMGWTVVVNQNKMAMTDVVLTDPLPKGLSMTEEGMKAILVDGQPMASPYGATYDAKTGTLTITLGTIGAQHTITFETAVDMEQFVTADGNDQGKNIAVKNAITLAYTHDKKSLQTPPKAEATQTIHNQAIEKTGKPRTENGTTLLLIDYAMVINPNGLTLGNPAVITDTFPRNPAGNNVLELDATTLKLYEATVDKAGKVTPQATPLDGSQYQYTYTCVAPAANQLTVTLPNKPEDKTKTYYLTYSADVVGKPNGSIINMASFAGLGTAGTGVADGKNTVALRAFGSGNVFDQMPVPQGEIKIIKKDAQTGERIKGVKFDVLLGGGKMAEGTTDDQGEAVVKGLKAGASYTVQEVRAPLGYEISPESQAGKAVTAASGTLVPTITFTNSRTVYPITFIKVNESKNAVPGAEFILIPDAAMGTVPPIQPAISQANGLVRFTDVPWGSYLIKETKAPAGYYRTEQVGKVTLAPDGSYGLITDQATGAPWEKVDLLQAIVNKRIPNNDDPELVIPPFGGSVGSGGNSGTGNVPVKQDPSQPLVTPEPGQLGVPLKPENPLQPADPLNPVDSAVPVPPALPEAEQQGQQNNADDAHSTIGDQGVPTGSVTGGNDGAVAGDGMSNDGAVAGDGMSKGVRGSNGATAGGGADQDPQTGDDTPLALVVGLLLVSLTGMAIVLRKKS